MVNSRVGNTAEPRTNVRSQAKTAVRTQKHPSATWMQAASWLEMEDTEWENFCWQISSAHPLVEVFPNPEYRVPWPDQEALHPITDPWRRVEWELNFGESAARITSARIRKAFVAWTHCLDGHGLVQDTVGDVAGRCGVSIAESAEALKFLQMLDPPGIGARTVQEAVRIQLERMDQAGDAERALLSQPMQNWLREPSWLAHRLNLPVPAVETGLAHIRACHPYPVRGDKSREWIAMPQPSLWAQWDSSRRQWSVTVNDAYELRWRKETFPPKAGHLPQEDDTARALIESSRRRHEVLIKVTTTLITGQTPFCLGDTVQPRPMTVAAVAKSSRVHPSTVRRVLSGRWIGLPRGIIRLTSLVFTQTTHQSGALARIRYWIEQGVTSDRLVSEHLSQEGYHVSRRTVAKWRRELGLAPPRSQQGRNHNE